MGDRLFCGGGGCGIQHAGGRGRDRFQYGAGVVHKMEPVRGECGMGENKSKGQVLKMNEELLAVFCLLRNCGFHVETHRKCVPVSCSVSMGPLGFAEFLMLVSQLLPPDC